MRTLRQGVRERVMARGAVERVLEIYREVGEEIKTTYATARAILTAAVVIKEITTWVPDCRYCNGSGLVGIAKNRELGFEECPVCNGKGK